MLLPSNTDFYTTRPHPYVGASPPPAGPAGRLLPRPRELEALEGSIELGPAEALPPATLAGVESALAATSGRLQARLGAVAAAPLEGEESYSIVPTGDGLLLEARARRGLRHGLATLALLREPAAAGAAVRLPRVRVADAPATPIRFLGGWALWRAEGLREAIDLAAAFKGNRVLYNAWGWIPGDVLTPEDAFLVRYARERGIELVHELRRMSFGKDYAIAEPSHRRTILEAYLRAADGGFRSFGLLFDDVPWETAEDECRLAEEVYAALAERLGASGPPELFVCPQHYWYPGQMDAAWKGRAGAEETARQRAYLETYGRRLRPEIHVYIANYWGDHPADYARALCEGFTELVGRRPIFFDNQLINDYRLGALYPFALAARPPDFGDHHAGYNLNCGRPFAAYAASAATALSYAWNPAAHEPAAALGAAMAWLHGPDPGRVEAAVQAIDGLAALANAWAGGETTALSHYATIQAQLRDGRVAPGTIERWRRDLRGVRESWLAALRAPASGASELSHRALIEMVRSNHRLDRDLELFAGHHAACEQAGRGDGSALERFAQLADAVERDALEAVAGILPHAPNLAPLLERPDALAPRESQAWSWVEYFHSSTRRVLSSLRPEWSAAIRARLEAFGRSAGT